MGPGTAVREVIEEREQQCLGPYAALASASKGRLRPEPQDPYRTIFQRDRDRILHTKAFRRLKRKTQVFLAPRGDHYRTRLTHTLEVAQISRSVARALFLNEDLTEAIALGHDLGHTPFGHAGEAVLDELFEPGFRHAEQSLRVVDLLERRHDQWGLNLSQEVRDGILFHSKGKAILDRTPAEAPPSMEAGILAVCDAIAYVSHDIDDAIRAKVIVPHDLPQDAVRRLGHTTSERIDSVVVGLIEGSQDGTVGIATDVLEAMKALRNYLYTEVYPAEPIDFEISKAKHLLRELYVFLRDHPTPELLDYGPGDSPARCTVDFVAGMTDEYALQLCEQLLLPAPWKR